MSTIGSIQQHMQRGGFSRVEAERLEQLMLKCDEAAKNADALGDPQLTEYVIATAQAASTR
jgi:hypothetical protein